MILQNGVFTHRLEGFLYSEEAADRFLFKMELISAIADRLEGRMTDIRELARPEDEWPDGEE